jgi:hypothetical protein
MYSPVTSASATWVIYWSTVTDLIGTPGRGNLVERKCTAKYSANMRTGVSAVSPTRIGENPFTLAYTTHARQPVP